MGIYVDATALRVAIPMLFHVAFMSRLQHKEWRFIAYTVPWFNVTALIGLSHL